MIDEANRIKDRLRSCQTVEDVRSVADDERVKVRDMASTDEGKPLAHQIANLKEYRIRQIRGEI